MLQFKHELDLALGPKFFHLRCLYKDFVLSVQTFSAFQIYVQEKSLWTGQLG
jgi:hypothetical protein